MDVFEVALNRILKEQPCSACEGSGESGLDDMGTPTQCDVCAGEGKLRVLKRRDPVLFRRTPG